jgi:glutamate--cysteine ligase
LLDLTYQYFSPQGWKKSNNLSNSSRLVIVAAEKYGIDWRITPGTRIVTLTYQGQEKSYYNQIPASTSALAKYATNNKKITSNLLQQAGISVPRSFKLRGENKNDYWQEVYDTLQKPLVVKPTNGNQGQNIAIGIDNYLEYLAAIEVAADFSSDEDSGVIIEEMFQNGEEYRILASQEKVIGIVKREPANVIGDGRSTIKKLITLKNKEDIRGIKGSDKSHLKIRMDKNLKNYLAEQNLDLSTVVAAGRKVYLRQVSNISQGGDAIDFTDLAHKSVHEIALKAIRTIPGLSFAGIDFMTLDITQPQTKDSYVIIEINDSPGFDIHDAPYVGQNRHAADEFLKLMFPELDI